jgi:hypothetical protein
LSKCFCQWNKNCLQLVTSFTHTVYTVWISTCLVFNLTSSQKGLFQGYILHLSVNIMRNPLSSHRWIHPCESNHIHYPLYGHHCNMWFSIGQFSK